MFICADNIERPGPMQYPAIRPVSGGLRLTMVAALIPLTACNPGIVDNRPLWAHNVDAGDAIGCRRLGVIGVATWSSFGWIKRDTYCIERELATMAKQSTTALGGNLSIPLNAVSDGRQRYAVYRCPSAE